MVVLVLNFENFKALSGQHRIYYYEGLNFFDFHFLVDGQIIKSTIMKDQLDNLQRFFSHKMFYGAIRIEFNIAIPKNNIFSEVSEGIKVDLPVQEDVSQDEEIKNKNIQREGVEE